MGTGAFSTVREGYHRVEPENTYAIKCVHRKKLSKEDEAALLDEVSILKEMKHHNIIRLYDFFTEPGWYYLVMEKMSGGELFDRIVAKAYYNEKEARDVCIILLEAVNYCHMHHVAHRDLVRCENPWVQKCVFFSSKFVHFGGQSCLHQIC